MVEHLTQSRWVAFTLAFATVLTGLDVSNPTIGYLLFALMDTVAGLIYYASRRRLRSRSYVDGLLRKSLVVIFILAMVYLERAVLRIEGIATATAVFYIVGEVLSIAEKMALMGAPIPRWLKERLSEYHETKETNGDARAD